jgi:hypothetical protein
MFPDDEMDPLAKKETQQVYLLVLCGPLCFLLVLLHLYTRTHHEPPPRTGTHSTSSKALWGRIPAIPAQFTYPSQQ